MKPLKPVDVKAMRNAILSGIGTGIGFLLLYMTAEKIHPGVAKRLKGGGP